MMSLYSFFSAIELGLIYSLMVLGLFISYRILNIPDLTVDGSFTLGAAVAVVATLAGHPVLGLLLAVLAGAAAGFVTALLQTRMKIQPILAGIITMTALYSINLMVMDNKANLPLAQGGSIYNNLPGWLLSVLQRCWCCFCRRRLGWRCGRRGTTRRWCAPPRSTPTG